jgi:hypothetical protein
MLKEFCNNVIVILCAEYVVKLDEVPFVPSQY